MGNISNVKQLTAILLAVVLVGATANVGVVNAQQESNFSVYENSDHGIKIKYPADWRISEVVKNDAFQVLFGELSCDRAPLIPCRIKQLVFIEVADLPGKTSLDQATQEYISVLEKYRNFEILQSDPAVLSGLSAHKLVFTWTKSDGGSSSGSPETNQMKSMAILAINNEKMVVISFYPASSYENRYSHYLPTLQEMIDSFWVSEDDYVRFKQCVELSAEDALSYCDKVLEIDPNHFFALIFKGLALGELGRDEEAISYFDRALEIDPDDADVLKYKELALSKLGKQADISVAMKHKKKLTLVSVKNNSDEEVFGFQMKIDDGKIRYAKARGWDRDRIDQSTIIVQTGDRPIKPGKALILMIVVDNHVSSFEWTVFDTAGNMMAQGDVRPKV